MSFKVSINEKSLKGVEDNVKQLFDKVISNRKLMSDIGQTIINDVKMQTRMGNSIPEGRRFDPLSSSSWIKQREAIFQAGGTHELFSLRRSNLTVSGQLLDSMRSEASKGSVRVYFAGLHQPYTAKYKESWKRRAHMRSGHKVSAHTVNSSRSGSRKIGSQLKNEDLAKYVADAGRPFFGVRDLLQKRINTMIIAAIRRASEVARLFK